jgi:hypothetical protein
MKTIVRKATNVSLYLLPDITAVVLGAERMQVGAHPVEFFVSDCDLSNAVLHENVPDIEGWVPWKYLFDAGAWTLNPDWVDPDPQPQPQPE